MTGLSSINVNFSGNYPVLKSNNSIEPSFGWQRGRKRREALEKQKAQEGDEAVFGQKTPVESKELRAFKNRVEEIKKGFEIPEQRNLYLRNFANVEMQDHMERFFQKKEKLEAMKYIVESIDPEGRSGRRFYHFTCGALTNHLKYFNPKDVNEAIKAITGHVHKYLDREKGEEAATANKVYDRIVDSLFEYPQFDKLKAADKLKAVKTIAENTIITTHEEDEADTCEAIYMSLQGFIEAGFKANESKEKAEAEAILNKKFGDIGIEDTDFYE